MTSDLIARHLAQLRDLRAFSANESYKPSLDWAIASLSALPAAGGTDFTSRFTESQARGWKAVCATLDEIDPDWILEGHKAGKTGVQRACDAIRRLATTPQPSAARLRDALRCVLDIGTRRLLLPSEVTHWEALLAESDAAVGAQGDAFDAVLLRQAVARGWCAPENAGKEMDVDLAHAIVREVLALQPAAPAAGRCQECCGSPCECPSGMKGTAPAAGKGVERIISEMRGEAYAFGSSWVSGRKLAEWANRLSALTRQSVAKVSTRCSICGEPQWNSPSGVTCDNGHGGAAPADTPQSEERND